ncbi:hypothetical protein [Natrialba asiatica]|uniref:Uncharacterized protein n=1 Tax=Natrialba asiatica (strain ATCC 700177 / DSM 12278 / JCM 9576 / FERM P-10747 / NBRC 102637 / 172P1) TaxID=29540 RepID=M0AS36_NATA1|nr:hypothetical protein [Natrialba asiatica]ELZ00763.1 hypothetical protein C481_11030 [Natrialba asiatica DSM 12278]
MSTQDDSELSIAKPEDFFVTRSDDDELQPVTQKLPGVQEHVRVVPMTMGDINKYGGSGDRLNPNELASEEVAELFNEHWYDVREHDNLDVTAEMVEEDMIAFGVDGLLTAILRASGYDIQNGVNMENLEMLEKIDDPEKLGKLMELAESRN